MEIAICDDNAAFAALVEQTIMTCPVRNTSCDVFSSGDALLRCIGGGSRYSIYFLDIEMEGTDGVQTAGQIRRRDSRAVIIFMTSHKEYVYEVFEALPFRFLLKPLETERIRTVFMEAVEHMYTAQKLFFFKTDREIHQIPYEDILYFEGQGRRVQIHVRDGAHLFYQKISDVMAALDANLFCRIHASYIVNMEFIRSIDEKAVTMAGGETLPISRTYRREVRQRHLQFIAWKSGV